MIKILLIFLLPLILNASKILSYNIYDRTDRADVMITFDTPYEGVITQNISESKIIIKLTDAKIESSKIKKLSSKFLNSITITPMADYTQIVASVADSVTLKASKTSDSYGLRLRFSSQTSTSTNVQTKENTLLSSLPTKKDGDMTQNYYIVTAILIIGILLLLFIKRKLGLKNQKQSSWLFKETQQSQTNQQQMPISSNAENVSIRFQKKLNDTNSVVMLDFGEQSYLVLMGLNNILLDKFTDNKPVTQEDFESILQNRHQELDDFLTLKHESKEPLQAYKERAASISYEV